MIRSYLESDLAALAELFTSAVHGLAREDYDATQLAAWAPLSPDLDHWVVRLAGLRTIVAELDTRLAGFISYQQNGHIDLVYVSPLYSRRGIASALYDEVETVLRSEGVSELFTEASKTARPFFERHGFSVTEEQNIEVRGAVFRRYAMRKAIVQPGSATDF